MKKALTVLALLVVLLGTAAPSEAWGRWGWGGGCCWWPGPVFGGVFWGPPVASAVFPGPFVGVPPFAFAAPGPFGPFSPWQPVVSMPASVVVTTAPRAPAVQREVVYPNGRHVLLGDGVTQPWQWVWVPAAPPPPPGPPR